MKNVAGIASIVFAAFLVIRCSNNATTGVGDQGKVITEEPKRQPGGPPPSELGKGKDTGPFSSVSVPVQWSNIFVLTVPSGLVIDTGLPKTSQPATEAGTFVSGEL